MQVLRQVHLKNWKSVAEARVEFRALNVIVGANGSGKSNLLSVFRLLNAMFARSNGLRIYVTQEGGTSSVLRHGAGHSPIAELSLSFATNTGVTDYRARWAAAAQNSLIFTNEEVSYLKAGASKPQVVELGAGHQESNLEAAAEHEQTAQVCLGLLRRCRLYHFHDTSPQASIRRGSASLRIVFSTQTVVILLRCCTSIRSDTRLF